MSANQTHRNAFQQLRGFAAGLLRRLRKDKCPRRVAILERVVLSPKHSLVLIEVEGRKLLVGTPADGPATFYALESSSCSAHAPAISSANGVECRGYVC